MPPRDAEIPSVMRELLKPEGDGAEGEEVADAEGRKGLSGKVRAWVAQVLAKQQATQSGRSYILNTHDVVHEPCLDMEMQVINLDTVLHAIEPRRKLLPRRQKRAEKAGSADVPRYVEVVVQGGVDLPARSGAVDAVGTTKHTVECRFQGKTISTEIKEGSNPIWNQIVHLPMTVPHGDWSQRALLDMRDEVTFNLFDQTRKTEGDAREANVRVQRDERRWLGEFTLPFGTLYRNGKVEGRFPLSMPPILLGYEKDANSPSTGLAPASALNLFVTVEPALPPPKDSERERVSRRDARMQEAAAAWVKRQLSSLPKEQRFQRQLRVFAPAHDGERTLICRYVRPQPPPEELGKSKQHLLRFVSLIPYLDDSSLGAKLDVWNTSDSFLDLCAGDEEEHALLLCNYLLHAGKERGLQAYVVLGTGIPEGETAYVLTRGGQSREHQLWNASTGRVYSVTDSALPLSSVGCVFNDANVWANIQTSSSPAGVDWRLDDPTKWRAFFGPKGYPRPATLQSVQTATLQYRRTPEEQRKEVEREVEARLAQEIEDLRGHRPTDWNRSVAAKLRPLLKRFEEHANGTKLLTKEEHDASLERVRASYKLVGFPMNVSFTEIQPLLDKIRNTNIWMSDGPKLQFVLATYVHAYPNNICSVWVYVASLEDMRAGATASVG